MFFRKKKKNSEPPVAPVTEQQPTTFAVKQKSHKLSITIKVLSGALALTCVGFMVYSGILFFHDLNHEESSTTSYLTLMGKNITDSQKVFADRTLFGTENQEKISDYAFIGTKLFLSESKITPSSLSYENKANIVGENNEDFFLYDITNNIKKHESKRSSFENGCFYIELNKLTEGDYLIYPDPHDNGVTPYCNPFSFADKKTIHTSIYTLPDEQGNRKQITLKNNAASPYSLLTVKSCGSYLPDNYYDVVVFASRYTFDTIAVKETINNYSEEINELGKDTSYKIKYANTMQEAINTNATLSIAIGDNNQTTDYTSLYTRGKSDYSINQLSNSELNGYDKNPEIRELTGYLDMAGKSYSNVIGNNTQQSDSRIGKESFLIQETGYESKIATILKSY